MSERQASPEERGIFYYHIALAHALEHTARAAIEAEYAATHDPLTGALNRDGLKKHLESAEAPKAMLVVDATNFKSINDKYGYLTGDIVIVETHNVLKAAVRGNDVIARWGGDEFVVILNGESQQIVPDKIFKERRLERAREDHIDPIKGRIAQEMRRLLDERPELSEENLDLAVGGVVWPGNSSVEGLIAEAEAEMKIHKASQHQNDRHRVA